MATICRLEQRELVLLLPEIQEPEDAVLTVRKLIAGLAPAHSIDGQAVPVTLSVGIALYPDRGADAQALLEAADIAMYQARRTGRDRFQFFAKPAPKAARAHRNRKAPR
jgi:diguanylate cyclase (GGDEF)-like protein